MSERVQFRWILDGTIFGLVLFAVALIAFQVGRRESQVTSLTPTRDWRPVATRSRLSREFIWTATIGRPPVGNQHFRLRLTGQTRVLAMECNAEGVRVLEEAGRREHRVLAEHSWSPPLRERDELQAVKSLDSLGVFRGGRRVLLAACSVENWEEGAWEGVGLDKTFATFSYQKTGGVLFGDDFMHEEGELGQWESVSGKWKVHALKNPVRSANAFSFHGNGTNALALTGQWFWRNYRFSCAAHPLEESELGLLFCWRDAQNNYALTWQRSREDGLAWLRLVRTVHGKPGILAETPAPLVPTRWTRLKVSQLEGWITVSVDDRQVLEAVDPQPLLGGRVGLWTNGPRGTVFDDVAVAPVDTAVIDFTRDDGPMPAVVRVATKGREHKDAGPAELVQVLGLPLENLSVEATVQELATPEAQVTLLARRNAAGDALALRIVGEGAGGAAELVARRGGTETVLDRTPLPQAGHQAVLGLHVRGAQAWGSLNGTMLCFAQNLPATGRGTCAVRVPAGSAGRFLQRLAIRPQLPLPHIENRVGTFTHEESMEIWGDPVSEWIMAVTDHGPRYWHRSDFWQDVAVELDLDKLRGEGLGQTWGLVMRGILPSGPTPAVQFRVAGSGDEATFEFDPGTGETVALTPATAPRVLALERRQGRILAKADGEVLLIRPLPEGLTGLCRVGRFGDGLREKWAEALNVRADGVKTYSFKKAPTDWVPVAGTWEVTNRWQCDPRWSFYAGVQRHGPACNWNKREHGSDVSLEFFAGPKMDTSRGKKYEYAADLNAVLCGDGRDITSGYSIMFGGWNDKGSYILRGRDVLQETTDVRIPRGGSLHRRWFHIKIRKHGSKLTLWIDGRLAATADDPQPLDGKRFGLWTWDNGMMVAQVRVCTSSDLPAAVIYQQPSEPPGTPYD